MTEEEKKKLKKEMLADWVIENIENYDAWDFRPKVKDFLILLGFIKSKEGEE